MNKQRRQELGDVVEYLDDAINRLEEIRDDEQESFDNLPEGFQYSDPGNRMLDAIDALDGFVSDIETVKGRIECMAQNKKC